jgi:protease I
MADRDLKARKIAILVTDGFEQVELIEPRKALDNAGANYKTFVVSPKPERVRGWNFTDWGDEIAVDVPLDRARSQDFDALLLPGGVISPDALRIQPAAVEFVRAFFEDERLIAAICHGPWTLIETGRLQGRRITSWPSLKSDLQNAGAEWVDREVVVDRNLISSRKPDDIPAFNHEIVDLLRSGIERQRQMA